MQAAQDTILIITFQGVEMHPQGHRVPDLTSFKIVHRAMLEDTERIAELAKKLAVNKNQPNMARIHAMAKYAKSLYEEIGYHHEREDGLIWPLIVQKAGRRKDLVTMSNDHDILESALDRTIELIPLIRAHPTKYIDDFAGNSASLSTLLSEHIPQEERDVFPLIRSYISDREWRKIEKRIAKGMPFSHTAWMIAWMEFHSDANERDYLKRNAPLVFRLMLALYRNKFRALESRVFK